MISRIGTIISLLRHVFEVNHTCFLCTTVVLEYSVVITNLAVSIADAFRDLLISEHRRCDAYLDAVAGWASDT